MFNWAETESVAQGREVREGSCCLGPTLWWLGAIAVLPALCTSDCVGRPRPHLTAWVRLWMRGSIVGEEISRRFPHRWLCLVGRSNSPLQRLQRSQAAAGPLLVNDVTLQKIWKQFSQYASQHQVRTLVGIFAYVPAAPTSFASTSQFTLRNQPRSLNSTSGSDAHCRNEYRHHASFW